MPRTKNVIISKNPAYKYVVYDDESFEYTNLNKWVPVRTWHAPGVV